MKKLILTNNGIESYENFMEGRLNKDFNNRSFNKHLLDVELCINNMQNKIKEISISDIKNKVTTDVTKYKNEIKSLYYYRENLYNSITKEVKCFKTLGQIWFYLSNNDAELASQWSNNSLKDTKIYLNINFNKLEDYILLEQKIYYLNKNKVKLIMLTTDNKGCYGNKCFKAVDAALIRKEVDKRLPKINNKEKKKSPTKIINFDTPINKKEYNIKFKLVTSLNNKDGKIILPIKIEKFESVNAFKVGKHYLDIEGNKFITSKSINIVNDNIDDISSILINNNKHYLKINTLNNNKIEKGGDRIINNYYSYFLSFSKYKSNCNYNFFVDKQGNLKCSIKECNYNDFYYCNKKFYYNEREITYYVVCEVNSKINEKGLTSLLKSAKAVIREYSDQEYVKYFKYVSDYKTSATPEEADDFDIIKYKQINDLNVIINFNLEGVKVDFDLLRSKLKSYKNLQYAINENIAYSKYTPEEGELYKYHYREVPLYNGIELTAKQKAAVIKKYGTYNVPKLKINKTLISTISANDIIKNLYIKYFNIPEYDKDEFFIKLIKKACEEKNDEVIKDFMSFNLRYEDFRIDMETLGFQTEEINYIGQVLMEDLRFVDQIEVFYEDSEPESEEEE